MADELPSSPDDDASKAETIRITLPAKPDQATTKRETVRINLPGKPASTTSLPPSGVSPKKETTKIETLAGMSAPSAPPPPSAARPFVPPPPRPPSAPGAPLPPVKPLSGVTPPPKPPSMGARPTVPLKPAPAGSGVTARPPVAAQPAGLSPDPMTQKAAAPKKETARITLPPESAKPGMPKATIKMQQTQPLLSKPAPSLSQSGIVTAPAMSTATAEPDGAMNILSIAALVISLISFVLVFLAYNATSVS